MTKASWLIAEAAKCDEMAAKLDLRVVDGKATVGQARTMRNYAEALRLEAATGVAHCVCCRVPQPRCLNRQAMAARKAQEGAKLTLSQQRGES